MDKIYAYFKNISLLAIVDIATCLFLLVLAFMFFYHKRSLRVFLTLIGAIAAKVVIDALGVFLGNNAFALCSEVLRYFLLFLLVAVVVVYQSDLRSIFQRNAARHRLVPGRLRLRRRSARRHGRTFVGTSNDGETKHGRNHYHHPDHYGQQYSGNRYGT